MNARLNYGKAAPGVYDAMDALDQYLQTCGLDTSLIRMVQLRVSQINGCAYCLDMHWKDLRARHETEQRLYSLDAWRECPYYTDRERAAFAWAEAVTLITSGHATDAAYADVRPHFGDKELSDLTRSPRSMPGIARPSRRGSFPARTSPRWQRTESS